MRGAILGDIIGSRHERQEPCGKEFELFHPDCRYTDDTILTVAIADWLLTGDDLAKTLKRYYHANRGRGYGGMFKEWCKGESFAPFNSFGNGSAMRVSPVAWFYDTKEAVMAAAKASAEVTHNHPEGIKGAQAIALALFMARTGSTKGAIKLAMVLEFGYVVDYPNIKSTRGGYDCGATCQESVPPAIIAFLLGEDFEDVIRTAIAMGGDSDTIAAMAGSIAEAFYGVPSHMWERAITLLSQPLLGVIDRFDTLITT
jgi:ADP-ribosylglycohydrolase